MMTNTIQRQKTQDNAMENIIIYKAKALWMKTSIGGTCATKTLCNLLCLIPPRNVYSMYYIGKAILDISQYSF